MRFVISPAKSLDLSEETRYTSNYSEPQMQSRTQELVQTLAGMSAQELGKLMDISEQLAELNYERYQQFTPEYEPRNAKQALLCFNGDVYQSIEADTYGEEEFAYAQAHLRILSGLYGLLRPLDLIQPYRLEMGTKLSNKHGKDLYAFWGGQITDALNEELAQEEEPVLINLASNEYFKAVKRSKLQATVISPNFKDERNGKLMTISFYAKQARGAMVDFAIKEKVARPEQLKDFQGMGYQFRPEQSTDTEWLFTRKS